jgi:hypothetical protein
MVDSLESDEANCCIALNLKSSDIFSRTPWSSAMMPNHAKPQGQFLTFRAKFSPNGKIESIEISVGGYSLMLLLLVVSQSHPLASLLEGAKQLAGLFR